MDNKFSERVQAIQNGPLVDGLNAQVWLAHGSGVLSAHLPGVSVTLFDARSVPNKNGCRSPIVPDLKRSHLVLLLGWGAGKGLQGLPLFDQEKAIELLRSTQYDPEAHATLISITTSQLASWLAFVDYHCPDDCAVWSLSVGRPACIRWEGRTNG